MKNTILYYLGFFLPGIDKKEKAYEVAKQELTKATNIIQEIIKTAKIINGHKFLGTYFRIPDLTRKLVNLNAQLKRQTKKCSLWVQRARV